MRKTNEVCINRTKKSSSKEAVLLSIKKKNNKYKGKKSRRIKTKTGLFFGFNRFWRTLIQIGTRKKASKRNYNPKRRCFHLQCNLPDIHANVYQGGDVNIPKELLIEVLSRLPIKTLGRFMCVSKHWRGLILNDVPLENSPTLLFFSSKDANLPFETMNNEILVKHVRMPIDEDLSGDEQLVKAHSSCHGLVLVQIENGLFLWNPLTKFFNKVLTIDNSIVKQIMVASLCFCSVNDNYKVVMSTFSRTQAVYVATCGVRSWKKIKNPYLESVYEGPFFKGYRHWVSNWHSTRKGIVVFDPSMCKFVEIASPKPKEGIAYDFRSLGVLDECLSITRSEKNDKGNIVLLVMKEYGNGNSWEVMFNFANSPRFYDCRIKPLFRTKKGELLVGIHKGCCCCYIVQTCDDHGNILGDDEEAVWCDGDFYSKNVILYEESWSSPTDIKVYD